MGIRDSEHEPESVNLKHLAGRKQNVAFFDKRKLIPLAGYTGGFDFKTPLYDNLLVLDAGDTAPHSVCYDPDRNRIWIVCNTSPTRVLRLNPEDLTYDRLILPAGVNLGYRIAYDGKWIWVTTSDVPAEVVRINPDTLAYTVLYLPADRNFANGLCVGGLRGGTRYVWVTCFHNGAPWEVWLLRIDPATFPAYTETQFNALNVAWDGVREVVFDGRRVWVGGAGNGVVAWFDPETLVGTDCGTIPGFGSIYSGCWDGSYLWWGGSNGYIVKQNPTTYAYDFMKMQFAVSGTSRMHCFASDGKYIHIVNYDDGYYYIVHPETMEYSIHEIADAGLHGICFDGLNIWIVNGAGASRDVYRIVFHEPSRKFEHGQTATFAIDALANISIAVTFDGPFTRTPIVVVGLNDVTDQAASIVNVEAQTVTVNGFNARCRVAVVGAGGSTARFMWIATERSTHHP
jgi:hypothetical protein